MINNHNLPALRREAAAPDPLPRLQLCGRRPCACAGASVDGGIQSRLLSCHCSRARRLPAGRRTRQRARCRTRRSRPAARAVQRADARLSQHRRISRKTLTKFGVRSSEGTPPGRISSIDPAMTRAGTGAGTVGGLQSSVCALQRVYGLRFYGLRTTNYELRCEVSALRTPNSALP